MSRQRKTAVVLRPLRGEDLELGSRLLSVTAATLTADGMAGTIGELRQAQSNSANNATGPIERHGFVSPAAFRQMHFQSNAKAA